MSHISAEQAEYLYRELQHIFSSENLSPKARILRLKSTNDLLFSFLTHEIGVAFSSTHARMLFVQQNFMPNEDLMQRLHRFRVLSNHVVYDSDYQPTQDEYLASLLILAQAVSHFSELAEPELIAKIRVQKPFLELGNEKPPVQERIRWLDAVVLDVGELQTSKNGLNCCTVICDASRLGKIRVILQDCDGNQPGIRFSTLGRLLWKYARVYFFNITKVLGQDDLFATTANTLVVLEPDYLIQVTEVAKCFEDRRINPYIEIIDKYHISTYTKQLLLGSVVNGIFDEMICQPDKSFNDLFTQIINEFALELISIINRQIEDNTNFLDQFREDVQQHIQTLAFYAKEFLKDPEIEVSIEPSFYAPKYGLQGRLDLMIRYSNQQLDIIELKSGNAPDLNAYRTVKSDHAAQIQAYSLLLKSTFGQEARNSFILYSKAKLNEKPIRPVYCQLVDRQNLIWVRNHIVAYEQKIASNDWNWLSELFESDSESLPYHRILALTDFRHVIENLSEELFAWFKAFSSFLMREKRIAKIGTEGENNQFGFSSLWRSTITEKLERFDILYNLEIDKEKSNFNKFHLFLKRNSFPGDKKISNFRVDDIAVIYPVEPNGELKPLNHQILKCTIRELQADYVVVSLRNKQIDPRLFERSKFWALEHDLMEKNYQLLQQSCYKFVASANTRMQRILLGLEKPIFDNPIPFEHDHLSPEQKELIARILAARDYFLVQGPPGTGKTSFILKYLVKAIYHNTQQNILLLAFTNRAVDEICEKLDQLQLPYFRLGFGDEKRHQVWKSLVREKKFNEIRDYFNEIRIVVSTVSSFISNQPKLLFKPFHTTIVDEASQLLEPHLAGILVDTERFVLIGDEKQLPAVVTQPGYASQTDDPHLNALGIKDLSRSLFERLLNRCLRNGWTQAIGMITNHARMHVKIADFVNQKFYGNQLRPILYRQKAKLELYKPNSDNRIEHYLANHRLLFIDSPTDTINRVNRIEAQLTAQIADLVAKRYGKIFAAHCLGIITPFRAQIAEIYSRLTPELRSMITIDTVERYQGSERDIILISMAINSIYQLQNLQSLTSDKRVDRKLNVALTRAREQVVVIGNREILAQSPHYGQLIAWCQHEGSYIQLDEPILSTPQVS